MRAIGERLGSLTLCHHAAQAGQHPAAAALGVRRGRGRCKGAEHRSVSAWQSAGVVAGLQATAHSEAQHSRAFTCTTWQHPRPARNPPVCCMGGAACCWECCCAWGWEGAAWVECARDGWKAWGEEGGAEGAAEGRAAGVARPAERRGAGAAQGTREVASLGLRGHDAQGGAITRAAHPPT